MEAVESVLTGPVVALGLEYELDGVNVALLPADMDNACQRTSVLTTIARPFRECIPTQRSSHHCHPQPRLPLRCWWQPVRLLLKQEVSQLIWKAPLCQRKTTPMVCLQIRINVWTSWNSEWYPGTNKHMHAVMHLYCASNRIDWRSGDKVIIPKHRDVHTGVRWHGRTYVRSTPLNVVQYTITHHDTSVRSKALTIRFCETGTWSQSPSRRCELESSVGWNAPI
jgi:hypothetical protein